MNPSVPSAIDQYPPEPVAQSFLANLSNVNFKDIPLTGTDTLGLDTSANNLEQGLISFVTGWTGDSTSAATTTLNSFFAQFNETTKQLPNTFSGGSGTTFLSSLESYLGTISGSASQSTLEQNLTYAFEAYYTQVVVSTGGGELSVIQPSPTASDLDSQFQAAYTTFVNNYPYSSSESFNTFFTNFFNFTAVTAQTVNTDVPATVTLATYENIYNAFMPNPPPAGVTFPSFSDVMTTFYNQQVQQEGYFLPSQSFGAWVTYMQKVYTQSFSSSSGNFNTSVDTTSSKGVIILDKVLIDLIQVINTLQNVAAAQAQNLNFLTQWQQAYTDVGNQVHYFINGSDELSGNTTKQVADVRNNMNSENQNYSQQIQANQNVLSDNAKSVQSYVDQSNTDINNQSDLGNAIFQQLSTILSAIFQG